MFMKTKEKVKKSASEEQGSCAGTDRIRFVWFSREQSQNVYENKGEGQKVRFRGTRKLRRCWPHPVRLVLRGNKARMFMKTKEKVKKSASKE